jgi:hypothetical protein
MKKDDRTHEHLIELEAMSATKVVSISRARQFTSPPL